MKKIVLGVFIMFSIFTVHISPAQAGEIDILLDVLVEEGVLSPVKAEIVRDETKRRVAQEIAEGKSSSLPKWVQNMKVKQDLRLRYQYEKKNASADARNRGRLRYRIGIETKVVDQVKAGVGLATGSDDPRSTNQTFQNTFDTPDIRLDYAYAEYTPMKGTKIIGGKFKRKPYLWAPTDLLWDGDINPEGGSLHYEKSLSQNVDGFLNTGVWVLDENGTTDTTDPFMHYAQTGAQWKGDGLDAKVAGVYYGFNGVKGVDLDNEKNTNTQNAGVSDGVLQYDYDSIGISAEFGVSKPLGLHLERVALFGDYINNISNNVDQNTGWAVGVKFGDKKVKKKGQWQGKYIYANLGKDAFPDTFPDSDRYGGSTDVKSHEVAFNYGLKKNVILGIDYYNSDRDKATSNKEQLVQADILFKF